MHSPVSAFAPSAPLPLPSLPARSTGAARPLAPRCSAAASARLRELTVGTRRGESASPSARAAVLELVAELEQTPWGGAGRGPLDADEGLAMLDGRWELVFQQARMGRGEAERGEPGKVQQASVALTDGEEGRRGRVLQNVDVGRGVVENRAEGGGWVGACLRVEAEFGVVEGSASEVEVLFRKAFFGVRGVEVAFPIAWIGGKGRLDTTYLSDEVRIGRGDKGTLFVLVRPDAV